MSLETWVSVGALAGFAIALVGYLSSAFRGLRTDISAMRLELKTDIATVGARVETLDERVYDLAVGRRTSPLIVPPSH